ncbi:MAG TPA: hypothetical protein VE251_00900 [Xanthobacteraceae bacterium]|jgi:hypothetical protein|nr:hypothetical protein [Xanthobacteraceae bacterium]
MFGNLMKAAIGVLIETPIAVAADIITMGGALTDKKEPYTATAVKRIVENIAEATDPKEQ